MESDPSNDPTTTKQRVPSHIDDDIRLEHTESGKEIFVFDPYNPLNQEITVPEIQEILRKYGLNMPIHNEVLYRRAFIHRSYIRRPDIENQTNGVVIADAPPGCMPLRTKCNETLEFLGDGVLDCVTKFYLYKRFPKQNEGFMTEKKIALVKNESIGMLAREIGLHKWFVLSKHAENKQTRTNLKKLGCLFEAFVGAIFLDFNRVNIDDADHWFRDVFRSGAGFQAAQVFIETVFEQHVDWVNLLTNDDNYKNLLQVKIQKEFKITPIYMEISPQDPEKGFHMGVFLCLGADPHRMKPRDAVPFSTVTSFAGIHEWSASHGGRAFVFLGQGYHKIKKKAEQLACEDALRSGC